VRLVRSTLPLAALAVVLGLATAGVRTTLEREALAVGRVRDPAWLPSGKLLRLVSLGQRLAVSDLYWLRTVQYIGEGFEEPQRGWHALLPLAEIVTDLDPRHGYAYQMVSLCLADPARRFDEAYRLLDKGMRNVPDRWSLPLLYAQLKFIYEKDYKTAAEYARRAARAGNRPHLALLAASLALELDEAAEYALAATFLEESIPAAQEQHLKAELQARLGKVRSFEVLLRLEKTIERFRAERGRYPVQLQELAWSGYLDAVPADPSGGAFRYHPGFGTVESTVAGPRRPRP
jgi:tetratricopeptide (TPR) repeat protein